MKNKTIGNYTYMVVKYFTNKDGQLDWITSQWSKAEYAFKDCKSYRESHGKDSAFVFKAKQCIEI